MIELHESLEAFAKSPVTDWQRIYNSLCSLGCIDDRFTQWRNFIKQPIPEIDKLLDWWTKDHQRKVVESSATAAAGFARALNRMRGSEDTPLVTMDSLLPYPIPGGKTEGFVITDRDRNIIKRLQRKGYLTDRQEMIFIQMGALKNG